MKRIATIAIAGCAAAVSPAIADEITIDAPIQAVVVYPQGAAVTREGPVTLTAGNHTVVFDNIPVGIDASSIRVEGLGGDAQIQSVVVQTGKSDDDDNPVRQQLLEQIEELRDDLQALDDVLAALDAQRRFIVNLIDAGPAGFAELLGGQGAGVDQWEAAWETLGRGIYEIETEMRDVAFEQRDIEEQIEVLLDELAALPTTPQHLEILIETAATADAELSLTLSYRVGNAGWSPAYDAMLTTGGANEEPMVTLVRRAEITQNTGEDWTDVTLTLSTTRPSGGTEAPHVAETLVELFENNRFALPAEAEAVAADGAANMMPAPAPTPVQQAIADFGDFRADYIVPTPVTVESGAGTRTVQLATEHASADLYVEVAPRFAEEAYLTAAFTIDSEAPVLAGPVNLFRDGAYVGAGRVAFANAGTEIALGFGVDDNVRVTWTLVDRNSGERGLLTRIAFTELEYRATIENGHARPIEITVVDRLPVADDERIVVDRLQQMTEPTEEDVDGRRGVIAWTYEYEAGEVREIINAYVISWPAGLNVFGAN